MNNLNNQIKGKDLENKSLVEVRMRIFLLAARLFGTGFLCNVVAAHVVAAGPVVAHYTCSNE